jgi:simple sugar transport system permease protein
VVVSYIRRVTRFGLEIEAVGSAPDVARATGIPVLRTTTLVVLSSGALAGLAGFLLVAGQEHKLTQSLFLGYGFSGIVIAFLARLSVSGTLLSAILVAVLYTAADNLQVFYQLPRSLVDVIQALLLLCIVCSDVFVRYRIRIVA